MTEEERHAERIAELIRQAAGNLDGINPQLDKALTKANKLVETLEKAGRMAADLQGGQKDKIWSGLKRPGKTAVSTDCLRKYAHPS
jgi:hypothetical protein